MARAHPAPPRTGAPGRPRSEAARRAVLDAARQLLETKGYAGATIEAIAARSGVAKTTIYRWWPHRAALLVELLVELAATTVPVPQGRDPMRAMRAELRGIAVASVGTLGRLLTSLLGDAQQDPAVRNALVGGLFLPRTRGSAANVRSAQVAGEIRRDVPPNVAVSLLVGPVFYRMFVGHEPITDTYVRQVLQYVVEGIGPRRRHPAKRRPRSGKSSS